MLKIFLMLAVIGIYEFTIHKRTPTMMIISKMFKIDIIFLLYILKKNIRIFAY